VVLGTLVLPSPLEALTGSKMVSHTALSDGLFRELEVLVRVFQPVP
jgi:hypothetical protein